MNKTNVFWFRGNQELVQQWHSSFKKIKGKIYHVNLENEDSDSSFTGTLTFKQLSDFRLAFLHEDAHIKSFDDYPKDPATFRFMSDRTIECGCNSGYWLVGGEWCACYDCKGNGRRFPEAGMIMLRKDWKPEN